MFCHNSLNRLRQMFYNPFLLFFSFISNGPRFGIWSQFLCPTSLWAFFSFLTQDVLNSPYTLSASNLESTIFPNMPGFVEQYLENKIKGTTCAITRLWLLGPFRAQSQSWGWGVGERWGGVGKKERGKCTHIPTGISSSKLVTRGSSLSSSTFYLYLPPLSISLLPLWVT